MQLIICEKPNVAAKMAAALAEGQIEEKRHNGIKYYLLTRHDEKIAVVAAVGHVYSLAEAKKGFTYPVFDISWKPSYEVEKESSYTEAYVQTIEKLAKESNTYICACDYDIEGSLIGYNIIRFACNSEKGERMKFSALTQDDLVEAYENRTDFDYKNAQAGEARHTLDWYYGINLSRALMHAIRTAGSYQVMSIGRVQGPALDILVKKEKQISAFKSTPYWVVFGTCKDVRFDHAKDRFEKKEEALAAIAASSEASTVAKIEKKEYAQEPFPPFDLTSLQVEAYRVFSFPPSQTLEMAQHLYEATMISYPRTSSQKLPAKLNFPKIMSGLAKMPEYGKFANELIEKKRFKPLEGKKEDPAHPAIHPTGQQGSVGEREKKLYDLIVKRFLSCFAENARRENQKVELLSGTQTYRAGGNRTTFQGWFAFYSPYVKLDEVTLPPFLEKESVQLRDIKNEEKKTQPPRRYTPASLISELEDFGLGTKATRSGIVDTLFKRGYLDGKSITVTSFGMAVHEALAKNAPDILDEELTKVIEEEMDLIADGQVKPQTAIDDGRKLLEKIIVQFKEHESDIGKELAFGLKKKDFAANLLGKCPTCKEGELRSIKSRFGKFFVGCSSYPKCTQTYPLPQFGKIEPLGSVCEKCGTPQIKVIRPKRKPFMMCLLPTCETKAGWGTYNKDAKAKPAAATGAKEAKPTSAAPAATAVHKPGAATPAKSATTAMQKPAPATAKATGATAHKPAASAPQKPSDANATMVQKAKPPAAAASSQKTPAVQAKPAIPQQKAPVAGAQQKSASSISPILPVTSAQQAKKEAKTPPNAAAQQKTAPISSPLRLASSAQIAQPKPSVPASHIPPAASAQQPAQNIPPAPSALPAKKKAAKPRLKKKKPGVLA
jgi:DNA topoisomerase-1